MKILGHVTGLAISDISQKEEKSLDINRFDGRRLDIVVDDCHLSVVFKASRNIELINQIFQSETFVTIGYLEIL